MNYITHILEPKRLLLVWQGPEGTKRTRFSVAELLRQGEEAVRFRYLSNTSDFASACAEGFVNYPAFRKTDQTYDLGVVDTFIRRLPPRTRGDYGQYLEQFRLVPDKRISDFALLAYTGAKLPGDGFSIINPLEDVAGPCEILIEVAGFRHASELPQDHLRPGDMASFVPESDNMHDLNAVAIFVRGRKIGYVPRQQAGAIRKWCQTDTFSAQVERVNGRPERPLIYLFATLASVAQVAPRTHSA
jgi:hypothetical protein